MREAGGIAWIVDSPTLSRKLPTHFEYLKTHALRRCMEQL